MMTREEYYTAPPQEVFEDVKRSALAIWSSYDNSFGYVDEKGGRVAGITNLRDNCAYIVAMFDSKNQNLLLDLVKLPASRKWLEDLLEFGRQ